MIQFAAIRKGNEIYLGKRHCDIINASPFGMFKNKKSIQGFVTDTGEFLDREGAGAHAIRCGQIKKLKWGKQLYSEDIY